MLRHRYDRITRTMDDEQLRNWAVRVVASLWDVLICLILACGIGVYLFYNIIATRDARRKIVDNKLEKLACLALHYTPPDNAFHRDLMPLYPNCPPYQAPKTTPSSSSAPRPRAVGRPSPTSPVSTVVRIAPAASGQPARSPSAAGPVAQTRTIVQPAPTVTRIVRPPPRTVTPPQPQPSSTPPAGILAPVCGLLPPLQKLLCRS